MIPDLDIILGEGENYTTEFKESADKSLASEVCAFANASGGRIFIGVDDNGKIIGTDTSNAARSRVQDTINQIEPRLSADVAVHENIIVVAVPEGANKPYSCSKGFYLRSGPNSQKLERDSIIDFLQTEGKVIYDSIVNEKYPITDNFDEAEYLKYLKKSNISDAKDFNGSIIENIDNAIVFLKRNLRVRYEIKTVQRKNILELPEDALREAVINAVCHRDYFEKGARVMVEIFDDRVEITNPGTAPKGITKENFGSTSVTRNPVIASLLHRAHYIERMGTGIMKMIRAMETANLEKPVFKTEGFFFKVIFKRDSLQHDTNYGTINGTINKILCALSKTPQITYDALSKQLDMPRRTVAREIQMLREQGIIKRIGGRKNGYWQVIK